MVNEEKIKIMTKMAILDQKYKKEKEVISGFYKKDYISYQMIWTGISSTIAYGIMLLLFLCVNMETYMQNINQMDLFGQIKWMIILYILFLSVMLFISYKVYSDRYKQSEKIAKQYTQHLRELEKCYNQKRGNQEKRKVEE